MPQFTDLLAYSLILLFGKFPLPLARAFGSALGRLSYRLNLSMVKLTRSNIARCLGDLTPQQQEQLVRDSVIETTRLAFETAVVWRLEDEQLLPLIHEVKGLVHLETALAQQKGVIMLAPHLGNWEVLGRYLAGFGSVIYLFQPPRLQKLDQLVRARRAKSGAQLAPTNRRGLAAILSVLKAGGISGILPDQAPKEAVSGVVAPFFGNPAFTMTLVQKLLHNSGSCAMFGFAERTMQGFIIHFLPAPNELYSPEVLTSVTALNAGVEACVRQCPAQYQWEYRRFKQKYLGHEGGEI